MYTITYNLIEDLPHSNRFYSVLKAFSEHVYNEVDEQFYELVQSYFRFRRLNDSEPVYSLEEAYLELLILGVLWQVYSGDAMVSDSSTNDLLTKMFEVREHHKNLKPVVDFVRGICMTTMMSPDLYDHISLAQPLAENLLKLIEWLEATGEFKHEVYFLNQWYAFVRLQEQSKQVQILQEMLSLGIWFEQESKLHIGQYTKEVERFLNEIRPKHYFKEDVLFCGRRRVEYHLNMVGAVWLNKAYKHAFAETNHKIIILPTCLRISETECKAIVENGWMRCCQCDNSCAVHDVVSLAQSHQADVFMLPHNSSFSSPPESINLNDCGIIGVSCVLNLIEGGFMLRRHSIPAQCVILDYCGCKAHWHHEGMPTQLNLEQLNEIFKS